MKIQILLLLCLSLGCAPKYDVRWISHETGKVYRTGEDLPSGWYDLCVDDECLPLGIDLPDRWWQQTGE